MTDQQIIQALAQQSLDQTVIDGTHVTADPESYIKGFLAGFATVEYSRHVLDDEQLRDVKAAAWDAGHRARPEARNPHD